MIQKKIIFFFLLGLSLNSTAQQLLIKLTTALDSFEHNYPQEKVFIHTDRSSYLAEQTIWFKAYSTIDGLPSNLSKIIYVELINEKNEVVEKRMLPLNNSTAYGDIFINKDTPSGVYSLNAYTLWMLNFPEYIFKKPISIYNTDLKTSSILAKQDFDIQFLPEGGELIETLPGKVAFKAIAENGFPINISGEISDSRNNKIVDINTQHDGMGYFEFTPAINESYKAVFLTTAGKEKIVQLPAAKPEGIVLSINNESLNNIFFKIKRSEKNNSTYNKILLVGRMNNSIVYSAEMNFDEGTTAGGINKKKLPSGILQLTAFSESGIPLAERLVFISNYQVPYINFQTDTLSTGQRQKNIYRLNLSDYKNISASISITNLSSDSSFYDENFLTSLLLTSDIKGYVHQPAYYFKDKSPETLKHLDLLLMTQGWRRLQWLPIISHQFPIIKYPIESSLTITGKITKPNGKNIIAAGRLDFITKTEDSATILSTINLSQNDQFVLSGLNFKKTASVFYQGTNTKKENAMVNVIFLPSYFDTLKHSKNHFIDFLKNSSLPTINFTGYYQKFISDKIENERMNVKVLSEIIVKSKRLSAADSLSNIYVSGAFENSDQTIALNERKMYTVWQYLQANISGINIGKNEFGETTVYFRNHGFSSIPPMIVADPTTNIDFYLNEIKVSKDMIESINPADFILVKIWKTTSSSTIGSDQGAIAFYTDKNNMNAVWRLKGFEMIKKEGYSVSREFYPVNYDYFPKDPLSQDYRPTLYWCPDIKLDRNGEAKIKFFNDDIARKFKVVIQGIDENGKIISTQKILQ